MLQVRWRGEITNVRIALPSPVTLRAADHYRARAAYCMEIAECATDCEARDLFVAVADCFEQVAQDAETLNGGALLN